MSEARREEELQLLNEIEERATDVWNEIETLPEISVGDYDQLFDRNILLKKAIKALRDKLLEECDV